MKKILLILILLSQITYSTQQDNNVYSIYLFGLVEHFYPVAETNEGNMRYLSFSKKETYKGWDLENGIGYYKDSYNVNAFNIYTNISKPSWQYEMIKPMLSIALHSKGVQYNSLERKIFVLPSIKIRIGSNKGLFFSIMPIPKIRPYTNGFIATEIGYSF